MNLDTPMGPVLYLNGLTVTFDGFKALDNLSLIVEPGELRCIIGPNGAGKTTLMDVVTGKTRADEGEALFGEKNDLTRMAMDGVTWQKIGVTASNGKYQFWVNDTIAQEGSYSKKLGELKEVDFFFNGIGSIDDINISDNQDKSFLSQNFN